MCNPRKVMIHLNRCIQQAWQQTIEQTCSANSQVGEIATISADIRLDAEMGQMALNMFERVLAGEFPGFTPWTRETDGRYSFNLEGVRLLYSTNSHSLVVEAQLTEQLSVEAKGAAEACGFTAGQVAVEAVGNYYSDGWGGYTEERAIHEAENKAELKLKDAIENLHREQHKTELEHASQEAKIKAEKAALEKLEILKQETRRAMRERITVIMANAQEQINHTMYRAVGEAYRQTLLHVVQQNGGRVIQDTATGSVINMELEVF